MHNIEHEIVYPSRPGFAFHDSRGIESGSIDEMDKVADFITRRSRLQLKDRVHAAWICLPLDSARPVGEAEIRMLNLGPSSGDVPAVVVFTKYDGLETTALNNLHREGGLSLRQAFRAMSDVAERLFKEQWLNRIYTSEPPKPPFVRLKDLHKPEGKCQALMKCTEEVLKDNKPAQKLFVTAQAYELEARLGYAIEDTVKLLLNMPNYEQEGVVDQLVQRALSWMPHVYHEVVRAENNSPLTLSMTLHSALLTGIYNAHDLE
ncbi:hypothetical protein FRB94_013610 [Tulasnella sp. JGI-2019a]|nr:hypothetical protein FRB93_007629 [Tulasnella sp. JGI-2019a]KAG9008250.1 hypothetical protein FRB94_013610 [Tulasnella sp. JGI-2019a]